MKTPSINSILSAAALTLLAGTALAGPLTPPVGPVTSTGKTLTEVEPRIAINTTNTPGDNDALFKITQPGSYYLTGNVTGVSGKMGIEINNINVTIDLNGFTLQGVQGSLDGIRTTVSGSNICIKNGAVSSWGGDGIDVSPSMGTSIVDVSADWNGGNGILTSSGCRVRGCIARQNTIAGIYVYDGCEVSDCVAGNNFGSGFYLLSGSSLINCTSSYNNVNGILASNGATITNCASSHNQLDGIQAGGSCTITGNTCYANGDDGIQADSNCTISRNTCNDNDTLGDGAGVYLTGPSNRVEDNQLNNNATGILCGGLDNFIAKNTAHANHMVGFNVTPGNEMAPVISNPGTNSFATMTPWSNVAY